LSKQPTNIILAKSLQFNNMKKLVLIIFLFNMLLSFPASAQNLYSGTSPFMDKLKIYNDREPVSGIIDSKIQHQLKYFSGSNHSSYLKSKPLEEQLDSVIVYSFSSETDSFPAFKSIYEYVEAEQMTIETVHEWNPLSKLWFRSYKYESKTDEQGNTTFSALYVWDSVTKLWICQRSQERISDGNGNPLVYSNYELRNWNGQEEGFREEYTYDEQGNRTSFTAYRWDITSKNWAGNQKIIWEYDSLGNVSLYLQHEWHLGNQAWELLNQFKYEYKYDEKGILESKIESRWHQPSETWITFSRSLYSYDDQGNMIYDFYYRWANTWLMNQKDEYAYDAAGNITLFIRYGRSNNTWVEEIKEEYRTDNLGNRTLYAHYSWDINLKAWTGNQKYERAFNENRMQILFINYQWDVQSAGWVSQSKGENEFDNEGRMILSIGYLWNSNTGSWIGNWKNENQFDEYGNQTVNAGYTWDNQSNNWLISNMTKNELSYDANGIILNVTQYVWNTSLMALLLNQKLFYFYSSRTYVERTNIGNQLNIEIYPNPAHDQLFIQGFENAWVSILDTSGNLLLEKKHQNTFIDISNLPNGVYLLKASMGTRVLTKRFVKR
jgi:YD repeat-containing protein